jgi:acetamidase/formamidase
VVIVDLIKGVPTPWPRLENDREIITTGSTKPLEDAFRISHQQMTRWVAELTGMSELDSYQLVSQAALSPVANVVDTVYTMVCKLPKSILGGVDPMQGMHARMRRTAAALALAGGAR